MSTALGGPRFFTEASPQIPLLLILLLLLRLYSSLRSVQNEIYPGWLFHVTWRIYIFTYIPSVNAQHAIDATGSLNRNKDIKTRHLTTSWCSVGSWEFVCCCYKTIIAEENETWCSSTRWCIIHVSFGHVRLLQWCFPGHYSDRWPNEMHHLMSLWIIGNLCYYANTQLNKIHNKANSFGQMLRIMSLNVDGSTIMLCTLPEG